MNHHHIHNLPPHLDHQVNQDLYCNTNYHQSQQNHLNNQLPSMSSNQHVRMNHSQQMHMRHPVAQNNIVQQGGGIECDFGSGLSFQNYRSSDSDINSRQRTPTTSYLDRQYNQQLHQYRQHQICEPINTYSHIQSNEMNNEYGIIQQQQQQQPSFPPYSSQSQVYTLPSTHYRQVQQMQPVQHHNNQTLVNPPIAVSQAQQLYQPSMQQAQLQTHYNHTNASLPTRQQEQQQYQPCLMTNECHPNQLNMYNQHQQSNNTELLDGGNVLVDGDEFDGLVNQDDGYYQNDTMDLHPTMKQQEEAARRLMRQQQQNETVNLMSIEMNPSLNGNGRYEQQILGQMLNPQVASEQSLERSLAQPSRLHAYHQTQPQLPVQQQQFVPRSKSDLDASIIQAKNQYSVNDATQVRPLSNTGYHPLDCIQNNPDLLTISTSNRPNVTEQALSPGQHQQRQHRERDSDFVDLRSCGTLSQDWLDSICRHLIEHMNRFGICVIDNFLGNAKGDSILKEVRRLYSSGQYSKGRLVSSNKLNSRTMGDRTGTIRNDRVIWIDGYEDGCSEINNLIQTLCSVITNSSRLSLYSNNGLDKVVINKRTKAHVACYPGNGTRYIKHVDNPNDDGRVITSIYYLNKDWNTKLDGGLLRMFPIGMDQVANIEPLFDRALFFWSDRRNPHEVLPAYKDRFAITVWYIGENRPI